MDHGYVGAPADYVKIALEKGKFIIVNMESGTLWYMKWFNKFIIVHDYYIPIAPPIVSWFISPSN